MLEIQGRKTRVRMQCTALDGKHIVMEEHREQYVNCDGCEAMRFIDYRADCETMRSIGYKAGSPSAIRPILFTYSTHAIPHPSSREAWRGGLTIVNKSLLVDHSATAVKAHVRLLNDHLLTNPNGQTRSPGRMVVTV